jgi:hypothetical protein
MDVNINSENKGIFKKRYKSNSSDGEDKTELYWEKICYYGLRWECRRKLNIMKAERKGMGNKEDLKCCRCGKKIEIEWSFNRENGCSNCSLWIP